MTQYTVTSPTLCSIDDGGASKHLIRTEKQKKLRRFENPLNSSF